MPAEFYNITRQEMADFLEPQGFRLVEIPGTFELVWGKRIDHNEWPLTLRVFSGINPNGQSREKGEDAIRVRLFYRRGDGKIIEMDGSKRVHRVVNWKANLQKRLNEDYLPEHACNCGCPMTVRNGRNGKFLGCTDYPNCKQTKPLKENDA